MVKSPALVIGGLAGTGSTTVGKILAKRLHWEHVYGGGIMRGMAKERGLTIEEFMRALSSEPETERQVDQRLIARIGRGRAVVESRVVAWILPDDLACFTVWLTCDEAERVRRVQEREQYADLTEARVRVLDREAVDAKRYQSLYGVDLTTHGHFDLTIDTATLTAEAVAERVLTAFRPIKR